MRCLAREPRKLEEPVRRHDHNVEIVRSDLTDVAELTAQIRDCSAAYYLIHSMVASGRTYAERDSQLARNFARAAT